MIQPKTNTVDEDDDDEDDDDDDDSSDDSDSEEDEDDEEEEEQQGGKQGSSADDRGRVTKRSSEGDEMNKNRQIEPPTSSNDQESSLSNVRNQPSR